MCSTTVLQPLPKYSLTGIFKGTQRDWILQVCLPDVLNRCATTTVLSVKQRLNIDWMTSWDVGGGSGWAWLENFDRELTTTTQSWPNAKWFFGSLIFGLAENYYSGQAKIFDQVLNYSDFYSLVSDSIQLSDSKKSKCHFPFLIWYRNQIFLTLVYFRVISLQLLNVLGAV